MFPCLDIIYSWRIASTVSRAFYWLGVVVVTLLVGCWLELVGWLLAREEAY
jgi:hypothetical protein